MRARKPLDRIAGADFTGFEHAVIPAGATCVLHTARHVVPIETYIELPARLPRLGNLHERAADAIHVANAHRRLGHSRCAEVFAERATGVEPRRDSRTNGCRSPFVAPKRVVIERVMVQRHFWSAVVLTFSLLVAFKTGLAKPHAPFDRQFADRTELAFVAKRRNDAGQYRVDAINRLAHTFPST